MDGFGYSEAPVLDQGHSFADMAETFGLDPNASALNMNLNMNTGAALATPPPYMPSPPPAATPVDAEPVLDFMNDHAPDTPVDNTIVAAAGAAAAAAAAAVPAQTIAPLTIGQAAANAAHTSMQQQFHPMVRAPHAQPPVPSSSTPHAGAPFSPAARLPASTSVRAPLPPPAPVNPSVDAARRRLRPAADELVARCWKVASSAPAFVSEARKVLRAPPPAAASASKAAGPAPSQSALPPDAPAVDMPPSSKKRLRDADGASAGAKRLRHAGGAFGGWALSAGAEAAILDALVSRITGGELSSARVLGYVRHAVVSGLVRPRAALGAVVGGGARARGRTAASLAELSAELLPCYRFEGTGASLSAECGDFLSAVALVLRVAREAPGAVPAASRLLGSARVVCLARASARRSPAHWAPVEEAVAALAVPDGPAALQRGLKKLAHGLAAGGSNFAVVASAAKRAELPEATATLTVAVPFAVGVLKQIFGGRVAQVLSDLWAKGPSGRGDLPLLVELARAGDTNSVLPLRDVARACEATVRFLAERSARVEWAAAWSAAWGGRKRLTKLLTDALPQARAELRSESASMLVALAVVGATAMALGPGMRLDEQGPQTVDAAGAAQREAADSDIAETVGDFTAFAVATLETGAAAEETPMWRSLGLWTLLFGSRCGALLSAAGCDHVRVAKVLRAWAGAPTGSPGAHSTGAHKSPSATQRPSTAQLAAQAAEVIALFATPAAHAIIDAADTSGDDRTMQALCDDYES